MAFLREPRAAVEQMLGVIDAWLPMYQEIEPRVAQMIGRDVANRRSDRETLDQATLIERTTGGLRWLPEAQVRRVIMAPSYFARPFNYIYQGADWRLFAYPIADAVLGAADAGIPPQAVVRLYRALGDGTRMRILKLLSGSRLVPDRVGTAAGTVEADHEAPPGAPAGGRPRDRHRRRQPHLLQPSTPATRGGRDRIAQLPRLTPPRIEAAADRRPRPISTASVRRITYRRTRT